MAYKKTIRCKDCGGVISTTANRCPHCGARTLHEVTNLNRRIIVGIIIGVIGFVIAMCVVDYKHCREEDMMRRMSAFQDNYEVTQNPLTVGQWLRHKFFMDSDDKKDKSSKRSRK